jgi:hypothetical protein
MTGFLSFTDRLREILLTLVSSNELHSKWINTLSYLENCGARKIAACEHPTQVKEEMLKHASEEFRHAHYLKRQIERVSAAVIHDYSLPYLLGGMRCIHYLSLLDLKVSRFLSQTGAFSKSAIKEMAYLLVTYAIELRAEELYPIYEQILRKGGSKVTVKSILLEEQEHLSEMRKNIEKLKDGALYAKQACIFEGELCQEWLQAIEKEIKAPDPAQYVF